MYNVTNSKNEVVATLSTKENQEVLSTLLKSWENTWNGFYAAGWNYKTKGLEGCKVM